MNNGFIYLHRQFLEWEWYNDNNTKSLFLHLLLKANHRDNLYQNKLIKRGQLQTGLFRLNIETGISIQTLRTCLKRLERTKEIIIKSTNKYSIITICKYDEYQNNKQATNKQLTNNQQATNKQLTTNNNDNNDNNDNINSFVLFWDEYHKITTLQKTDKEPTFKYWNKLNIKEQRIAYKNIKLYFDNLENKKYCKKARTYLSDKSYNDEFGLNGKSIIDKKNYVEYILFEETEKKYMDRKEFDNLWNNGKIAATTYKYITK